VTRSWCVILVLALTAAGCGDSNEPAATNVSTTQAAALTSTTSTVSDDGFAAPVPNGIPEVVAPHGLSTVELPDDVEGIAALFDRLPTELLGGRRSVEIATGRIMASYGTTGRVGCALVGLQAMDVSTGDFYPQGWTAESSVASLTSGADWEVEDFGREGDLFWIRWNTVCGEAGQPGTDVIFSTSWGRAGSPWMYTAGARDPEGRAELTEAFVASSS
jgi:hypothetical protein